MATRIDSKARIFTLDTGRLPAETYDLMATLRREHGINVEIVYPDAAETESMTTLFGIDSATDALVPMLLRAWSALSTWGTSTPHAPMSSTDRRVPG